MYEAVFSEFDLRAMGIKLEGETKYASCDCVGTCEETMNVRSVSKKCRGVVRKKKTRGDGTGALKISAHIPYGMYVKMFGMDLDTLKDGVYAYGANSVHRSMSIVQDVFDEDGVEKLKAYPNCVIETGIARKIENGAEEVAEVNLDISVMPDEDGNGEYEAVVVEGLDEEVKSKWMTEFSPALVKKEAAAAASSEQTDEQGTA